MTGQFQLTDDQLAIQEMAQRFTADNITPFAAQWDEEHHFPRDVIQKTGELGFGAIYVSEESGGIALGRLEAALITSAHSQALVDDMIVVEEGSIETAIALLLQVEKTLCEGAGAAGLAAVLAYPERFSGRRVGLVLCGGNIDNRLLTAVLQRQLVRDEKLFPLRIQLPDAAGMLGRLCTEIGEGGGNINSVVHDRMFLGHDAKSARVDVEIEVIDPVAKQRIATRLAASGFVVEQG